MRGAAGRGRAPLRAGVAVVLVGLLTSGGAVGGAVEAVGGGATTPGGPWIEGPQEPTDPGAAPEHAVTCGGFAPLAQDCGTGTHDLDGARWPFFVFRREPCGESMGVGLPPSPITFCFLGDGQSVVAGPLGQRITTCRGGLLPGGVSLGYACDTQGPALEELGSPMTHTCHVRAYGTMDPAVTGSGLPGGVGEWSCQGGHF